MSQDSIKAAIDAPRLAQKAKRSKNKAEKNASIYDQRQKNILVLAQAMANKNPVPRVSTGLGGYDISLGFSCRYALEMAMSVLSDLGDKEKGDLVAGLYSIFEKWKMEHGIYPPRRGLLGIATTVLMGHDKPVEPISFVVQCRTSSQNILARRMRW